MQVLFSKPDATANLQGTFCANTQGIFQGNVQYNVQYFQTSGEF